MVLVALTAIAAGLITLGVTRAASARSATPTRDTRYSGVCRIAGVARGYDPPLSFHPASRTFRFAGRGSCTGSIGARQPTRTIAVVTSIRGKTLVDSCSGFGITEGATGMLRGVGSRQARALHVAFHTDVFIDGLTVTTATIGDHGGAALGTGSILPDTATVKGCTQGTLEKLRFAITMRTVTPFVMAPARSPTG